MKKAENLGGKNDVFSRKKIYDDPILNNLSQKYHGKPKEFAIARDGNTFYICNYNGAEYTKLQAIPIAGNEDLLNYIEKGIDNGSIIDTESFNSAIDEFRTRERLDKCNSINAEIRRTAEANDSLAIGEQGEKPTNNNKGGYDSQGTNQLTELSTSNNDIYGFTSNNKIYLNRDKKIKKMKLTEERKKAIEEIKRMKQFPLSYEEAKAQTEKLLVWKNEQQEKRKMKENENKNENNLNYDREKVYEFFQSISQRAERESTQADRTMAETADNCRRSLETTQGVGRETKEIGAEIRQELENVAKKNGLWIEDVSSIAQTDKLISEGTAESIVYLSTDGKNVVKLNRMTFVNTVGGIYKFIDRIAANNEFAPQMAYEAVGFTKDKNGEVCMILKQSFIPNLTPATQEQINEDLKKRGFRRVKYDIAKRCWTNGEITIEDAKPKNVANADGVLHYYDIITQHATPQIKQLYESAVKSV